MKNGVALTDTTTIDLTQTTEITDITITGSTSLDLSGVLGMLQGA